MDKWILFLATVARWNRSDWMSSRMVVVGNTLLYLSCCIYLLTLVSPEFVDMSSRTAKIRSNVV